MMKIGFNMLLWTHFVTEKHYPIIEKLKIRVTMVKRMSSLKKRFPGYKTEKIRNKFTAGEYTFK